VADPDYFTLAELRALPDCSGSTFTDAQVNAAAAYFAAIVEAELWPMIARTYVDKFDGNDETSLDLSQSLNVALTSVTVDGTAVTTSLLTTSATGSLRYKNGTRWFANNANGIVVTYTAGESAVPADVKSACMWATRDRLLSQSDSSGIDVRKTSMSTDFGTTSYILPGENRPTGYPELDAIILRRQKSSPSVG
jgi:hypothetical protein